MKKPRKTKKVRVWAVLDMRGNFLTASLTRMGAEWAEEDYDHLTKIRPATLTYLTE